MLTNEAGEVTSHLQGMFNRTIRMLEAGVKPVYVFDGKPPTMKSGELAKRKAMKEKAVAEMEEAKEAGNVEDEDRFSKRTVSMTKEHQEDCKRLLRLMGVPVVEAPCEAESQCAALARAGKVYAAGSEDMDTLTFASPVLVRRLTFSEARKLPILEFRLADILTAMELTMPQFVDLCILCGCDYTDTIRGIGPKNALKLIKTHGTIEKVLESLDTTKFPLPESFDYAQARELFLHPEVTDPETLECKYAEPDEEALTKFLVEEKGFNPDRVARGIEKLKKARGGGSQRRMDSFFSAAPAPAGAGGGGGSAGPGGPKPKAGAGAAGAAKKKGAPDAKASAAKKFKK